MSEAPPWLAALQARVAAVITTPLDRSAGSLRARTDAYDSDAVAAVRDAANASARARLAVYNRQYWFRLFTVLQSAYPMCARAMGYWAFNGLAARFVLAHPPRGWDLDRLGDGFDAFVEGALEDEEPRRSWIVDLCRVDATWRAILREPPSTPFQVSPQIAARLLDARLVRSPSVALLCARPPALAFRVALARGELDDAAAPQDLHVPHRWWALVRERGGLRHVPLEHLEATLFALLERVTVRDAMQALESICPPEQRAALPALAQQWLARSAQLGLWSAARIDDPLTE